LISSLATTGAVELAADATNAPYEFVFVLLTGSRMTKELFIIGGGGSEVKESSR
jgi:hypothetical protein